MKTCATCKHFGYNPISGGGPQSYFPVSSSPAGGYKCGKMHYLGVQPKDAEDFQQLIAQAETCPDYDESDELVIGVGGASRLVIKPSTGFYKDAAGRWHFAWHGRKIF